MSKKFVKVFGLHNIFNVSSSGSTLDITSIKSTVADKVDGDSLVFITADEHDVQYGYPNTTKYIWTHNEIYPTNDASFIVNASSGKYLDISVNGYTIAYGVKLSDVSTATAETDGLASALSVKQYVDTVNTDEKQAITASADKMYLTGVTSAPNATENRLKGVANVSVYATNGTLHADRLEVGVNTTASGENSVAIGLNVKVTGNYSQVIGKNSSVLANGAYAEGENNIVEAPYAHATGYNNHIYNTATYSFAEGRNQIVYGAYSHAEGSGNTILSGGSFGHAEGGGNVVSGSRGHVEGDTTLAGHVSHAEGLDTFASDFGHVEGIASLAIGRGAHSEGYYTYAGGQGAHAEGYGALYDVFNNNTSYKNFTFNKANVIILHLPNNVSYDVITVTCPPTGIPSGGTPTPEIMAKVKVVYFYGSGNTYVVPLNTTTISSYTTDASNNGIFTFNTAPYFYVRDVFGSSSPIGSFRLTYVSLQALGTGAHVEGQYTLALNTGAHAEGISTEARGKASHAAGEYTIADNEAMTVVGKYNATGDPNTLFAVGIGTASATASRKNAFKVNTDGKIYVETGVQKNTGGSTTSVWNTAGSIIDLTTTTILDQYLKLSGGTMSNTNVVTNLNADLLDGKNASDFSLLNVGTITINTDNLQNSILTNINNVTEQGIYNIDINIVSGTTTIPTAGTLTVENVNGYIIQMINVSHFGTSFANQYYMREYNNDTWGNLVVYTNGIIVDGNNSNFYVFSGKYIRENYAPLTHSHGNITSTGSISSSVSIAAGDRLVIRDSDNGKIETTTITFNSSTDYYLSNKGTWEQHTDTKNTAGATNTDNKIYPVGATAQTVSALTYTDSSVYIQNGTLNVSSLNATNINGVTVGTSPKFTDENLLVTTSNNQAYLAGFSTTSTTGHGLTNASVYMLNGKLYSDKATVSVEGHGHGKITGDGKISASVSIESGDSLLIRDNNDNNIIKATTTTFGTNAGLYLNNKGEWGTPSGTYVHPSKTVTVTTSSTTLVTGATFKALNTVSYDASGHISGYNVSTLTLPTYTLSAGNNSGEIKLIASDNTSVSVKVKDINNAAYKNVDTNIVATSRNIPDSSAVAAYVANQIATKLEAVLVYKGTVASSNSLTSDISTGWTYVANATFSYTSAQAAPGTSAEPGDMFIRNSSTSAPYFDVIQTNIDPAKYAMKGHTHTVTVSGTTAQVSIQPKGSVTTTVTGKTTTFSGSYKPSGSVTTTVTGKTTTFSGSYKPAGSVTTTVTGKTTTFSGSYTPSGAVSVGTFGFNSANATVTNNLSVTNYAHTHSFNGKPATIIMEYQKSNDTTKNATASISGSITASYTPTGNVSATLSTTTSTAEISLTFASHSHSFNGQSTTFKGGYTPAGTISKPTISATLSSTSVTYATGGRTLTSSSVTVLSTGSVDSSVLTTYTYTTSTETLRLILGKPNVTVNGTSSTKYLTDVTLSTSTFNNANAVNAALSTTPVFYGNPSTISVSGTPLGTIGATSGNVSGSVTYTKATGVNAAFNGTQGNPSVSWTLSVNNHSHGITLSNTNISASYTPAGTISDRNSGVTPSISGTITVSYDKLSSAKGAFTGTASNISVSGTPLLNGPTSTFTGDNATINVSGTPLLNNPTSTFTGSDATISVSGTPLLNNPTSTFTGTTFTHSHDATLSGTTTTESPQS